MPLQTQLSNLITAIGTDYKTLRSWITGSSTGNLTGLTTTDKTSLLAAINEVNAKPTGGTPAAASETTAGIVELATLVEVSTGTDALRAVTAAGVRQERIALKNEIMGAGVPAALDTLDELAAALGDDANFAATTATALGNRLRVDVATQALTTAQQTNGQTNLNVYSKTEMGNPETDLVALYTTAKA